MGRWAPLLVKDDVLLLGRSKATLGGASKRGGLRRGAAGPEEMPQFNSLERPVYAVRLDTGVSSS